MKLRNFIIVLLAVLMVFAFASCKNEPEVKPGPSPSGYTPSDSTVYQLRIDSGVAGREHNSYDKLKLEWDVTSLTAGDTLTLKFRSERDMFQYDIRNGSDKWVYENDKGTFEEPVLGDGGWYTLTYTFGDKNCKGVEWSDNFYPQRHFGVYFRAHYIDNDIFEIMDISLLHEDGSVDELAVTQNNIKSSASLVADFDGKDYEWKREKNYPVFFVQDTDHDVDKVWLAAQKVAAGGTATPYENAASGYTYSFFEDKDCTKAFDFSTPINALTYIFYTEIANNNTIKFDLNGGSAKEGESDAFADQTVATAGTVAKPEAEPVVTGDKLFAVWCTDAEGKEPYDFATPVTGNLTLYARYDDPVYVTFDKNDGSADDLRLSRVPLLSGKTVTAPENPTYGDNYFAGWFLGDAENSFDFDTAITSNITLTAKWYEPVIVTLDPNYKIDDVAVEASSITTGYGIPMDEPKDPAERAGFFFDKWTKDAAGEQEYVFGEEGVAVTEAFTLYAQWIPARTVTFNFNDGETPTTKEVIVKNGEKVEAPKAEKVKPGYCLVGWFADGSETAFDLANTAIESDLSLKAKWEEGKIAQLTSTYTYIDNSTTSNFDKYRIKFTDGAYKTALEEEKAVLTFKYRSTSPITKFSVRGSFEYDYEKTIADNVTSYDVGDDGWISVVYTFPKAGTVDRKSKTITYGSDVTFYFDFISYTIVSGDLIEIQGMALNGKELTVDGGNTQSGSSSNKPDYKSINAKYDWADLTVKFELMEGADAIEDKTVAFGKTVAKPEDPSVDGYKFLGWFADDEFKTPFDFDRPITAAATVYAKFEVKVGNTYTVTFNPNYEGAESKNVEVDEGDSVTAIKVGRPGFYLDGWYDADKEGTIVDFSEYTASADDELFAYWKSPTKAYKFTATVDHSRFQLRLKKSVDSTLSSIQPGDVITLLVKFNTTSAVPTYFRLRTADTEKNITGADTDTEGWEKLPSADVDGWYSIAVTAPVRGENTVDKSQYSGIGGLYIAFESASSEAPFKATDTCIIKGIAYNGHELVDLRTGEWADDSPNREFGAYGGVKPNSEVIAP